ncbi:MAG: Ig-like domain-containing protein [Clostridiales bacterium]|nr:Ig-like domain-containing protein [Clostridiales bacterium]
MKKNNYIFNRVLSLLLSLVLIVTCVPVLSAYAEYSEMLLLDCYEKELEIGETFVLRTILSDGSMALDSAVYSSEDPSIVTVDTAGVITAVSKGNAFVNVTLKGSGINTRCYITVVDPEDNIVKTVTLSNDSAELEIGKTLLLTAECNVENVPLVWFSSDNSVATVNNGLVTGISEGIVTITVTDENFTAHAECEITVISEGEFEIAVSEDTVFVNNHILLRLLAPEGTEVTWKSSDNKIALVDERGIVTGISKGSVKITAEKKNSDKKAVANITVKSAPGGNITLTVRENEIRNGQTYYMSSHNYGGYVYWSSANTSVADVKDGMVTAKKQGVTVIRASSADGSYCATSVITVKGSAPVRFTYTSPNSAPLNSNVTLYAITDKQRTAVKFTVEDGGSEYTVDATDRTEDGNTYIWSAKYKFKTSGYHDVTSSSQFKGDTWASGEFAHTQAFVTSSSDLTTCTLSERRVSTELLQLIASFEGYASEYYYDNLAGGIVTTAYGKVLYEGDVFYNGITQAEAMAYLTNDTNFGAYTQHVNNYLLQNAIAYNQQQFDCLVCFSYNLGTNWLRTSDLSTLIISSSKDSNAVVTEPKVGDVMKVNVDDSLNVRSGPGTDYSIVAVLKNGDTVTLADTKLYNTSWYKIKLSSGLIGYCNSRYLVNYNASATGSLANIKMNAFAAEFLQWHKAGGSCVSGLLYRRIDELEIFFFGEYTRDGSRNKHGFTLPGCCN